MPYTMLTQLLRTQRHLLILDNLESITGTSLAIGHMLLQEEQEVLQHFLTDLVGGRTLVVLSSRSDETWLAKGTFGDNIYDLGGLDPEAASTLTDLILKRHRVEKYRNDTDVQKLIKLLDGFPLALEVVLTNLTRQTPKEILETLQFGGVDLNTGETQEKTENILRCIDFSYSNLSAEAQNVLTCLAPFTSVVCSNTMERYSVFLKQQPVLATLPVERFSQVVQQAKNWGLLKPNTDVPDFLHLQPTLPYFLRRRLSDTERAEMRSAIEMAFRLFYGEVSQALYAMLDSNDPQKRLEGQALTQLEYENLMTALNLALQAKVSILHPYMTLMAYLEGTQDHLRGLQLGQTVLACLKAVPDEKLKGPLGAEYAGVIDSIAKRQMQLKQYVEAETSYHEALRLFSQLEHTEEHVLNQLKAAIYHNLGFIAREQRQWPKAESYYQQAMHIYRSLNNLCGQASLFGELGTIAKEQRLWPSARNYYRQALSIFTELDDSSGLASTYHNLGNIAEEHEEWGEATRYYQQALHIYRKFNDLSNQVKTYLHLGTTCQRQALRDEAEGYYQQALQLAINVNDQHLQATLYSQLGFLAVEQKQPAQAEQYYEKGVQIYGDFNDAYRQAQIYCNWGLLSKKQSKWAQAESQLLQALETFETHQDDYSKDFVLRHLARVWQMSESTNLPSTIASIIDSTSDKVEALFREMLANKANGVGSDM